MLLAPLSRGIRFCTVALIAHFLEDIPPFTVDEGTEMIVSIIRLLVLSTNVYRGPLLAMFLNCCHWTHSSCSSTWPIVIPIPKGLGKDLTNPSNYRGIILSNLSKVLQKLVLSKGPSPLIESSPRRISC